MLDNESLPSSAFVAPFAFARRGLRYDKDLSIYPPTKLSEGSALSVEQVCTLLSGKMTEYLARNVRGTAASSFWKRVESQSTVTQDPTIGDSTSQITI
jgi:hypothetical protein